MSEYDELSVSAIPMDKTVFVLFLVCVTGILVMMISQIHIWIYYLRIKKNSMRIKKEYVLLIQNLCSVLRIRRPVCLYQGYGVKSSFVFGLINPAIYLPVKTFDIKELETILYHELTHYKQGDTFFKPLFGIIWNIYWFSLLSKILWKAAIRWTESNCDA